MARISERILMLELTSEEAQALAELGGRIGGDPKTTGRKHIDSIMRALEGAGYFHTPDSSGSPIERGGSIRFIR